MRRTPSPAALAVPSRPWLTRAPGECAFPVDGEGASLRSCCRPCGAATYCPAHTARMQGPPAPDGESLFAALRSLLENA